MANILALTAGDWNTGSNWDGGNVPGISDVAVMNGKTMTLPNNGVITCSKITSDSTLGLPNGFVSLLVSSDSTLTFTINANLERTGVVSASLVQLSTTSISNKDVTVNINGNISSKGTSAQGATVFLNASSTAAPLTITANVVGDCTAGGSQANSPAISIASTYGDITINVTGNVLYEGTAANYGVLCNNSQGFGKVTVSGYVMCSGHSSTASVNIAGTISDASFVTVGAGIVPGGVGAGVRIDRGMGTVINAAPDGVAIRPGIGSGGLSLGSSQSSVTINGDVMAGVTNNGIAIAAPVSATQLRQITVNGNLRSDTGVSGSGGSSQIVNISGCVFLTVNGDIDATYSDTTSASYLPVTMTSVQGVNSGLVVSGDILSATGGSTSGIKTVSITTGASPGMNQITVEGTVYGTANGVGISSAVTSIIQNVSISKVTVTTMMPFAKAYGAIENIVPVGYLDILDEYNYGVDGVSPLRNCGKVRFADTVVFKYNSVDNTPRTASLANSAAIIPATANVRSGVTVGYGTGTLIVPQAANVLDGITYDNGTVGTLSVGGNSETVDLSAVTSAVNAIKVKTDQLTFGSTGVVTEGGSGNAIDYTTRFDDLDLAVAAIPTLTYTARLNSIDTDLGNLIANNMRNNLVAGVVSSTDFIGLLNDTSTELSGGTPAYQRQAVVWSAPFNGIVTNTTDITINVPAGGTVAYIAGYTLVTGGTAQFSYACTEVDAVSQSVYTIPAGTLQMTTTVQ